MPDTKKHILAELTAITQSYEKLRSKVKGHLDFGDINRPGYVNVADRTLSANLIKENGEDYLISIRRLDKPEEVKR